MASLNNEGASFSSSTRRWEYAVFLSFRGEDTREGFTSHLYKALCNKGINTFIDDIDLPRGEEISEKLIQAIKNSSILVIVFSENYAESKWCLDELAEIVECREKDQEVQIRSIFYNVDPSEIRNQNGNFGIALANHEKKFKNNKDKVQRWRDALEKAAKAPGWHYKKGNATYKSESQFIQNIVEEISNAKLNWMPLYVAEYPVGINSRAEAIESLLDIGLDEVCTVGMYGLPGVGKTTIAKAVYNKIAKYFDGSSFLENVRENLGTNAGIIKLQKQLLNDISRDGKWKVGNSSKGITLIEETLRCKKVLLILDDVDDSTPIKNLLGKCNWFAPGSRAIITLRDRHLLTVVKENVCTTYKVKEFEVEQLNKHEALQLFKEHAFPRNNPHDEDYSKLATKFIDFANGLPLALKIIARDLCGRAKDEWESALEKYKKVPIKCIRNILQVIYDGLQDPEKDIFLDIACFFKGWYKDYVVKILNACELDPSFGISRLVDKCLITVDRYGRLSMHDLIQQMGKEVVRKQALDIPENRSRLCYKDSLEVLTGNKIIMALERCLHQSSISLKLEALGLYDCKNLRDLPDSIYKLQQFSNLQTPTSKSRPTWNSFDGSSEYGFAKMTQLNLCCCKGIIEIDPWMKPDYFPALELIDLSKTNIVTIPESISKFPRLEELVIRDCKLLREIQGLPQSIRRVYAEDCMLLDTQSPSGLLNQVIEMIGILPSRVCGRARSNKLMDPQLTNYFPSETEGAEYEGGNISMDPQFSNNFPSETKGVEYEGGVDRTIYFWGTEMPKWFNHQSVDNSISFFVGRKFPKLAVCIDPGRGVVSGNVHISINGYKISDQYFRHSCMFVGGNNLYLFSPTQWSLQRHLNESNPADQNLVEVSITYSTRYDGGSVKRWGVCVECTFSPQELLFFDFFPSQESETLPKHLKRLFLYCSLFPLGYEFGKGEMVQLWIAEGFIEERQRMEDTGCEYFRSLVSLGFIQLSRYDYSVDFYSYLSDEFDSNGGTGKLYKVNEAQASHLKMAISEGSNQSVLGDKLDGASEWTLYFSLPCESINDQMAIETLKRCTNLRTLLLLSGCGYNVKQVPRDLFLSLKLLRTLNLSQTLISELPSSIGNVKSLRYLDVSNTHIRRLPESIDCLSNMQTLKLRGCLDFVALPKNMKKLTNLRHLELDIVRQLISMPNRIGNLTNLQTLSAFLVGRDDECGIEELKNLNDLCGTFCISRLERVSSLDKAKEAALFNKMYLGKLELRWSDIRVVNPEEEEKILENLRPHSGLREIQILFYGGFKIPSWICDPSFADLVSITLYKWRNCEFLPSLGALPSLKFLFIREMNEVKKIDHQFCRNGSDKGFAKLEKLEINVMLNLEEWMGVENGDLPVLRKLTVEYSPKLIALPSLSCLNSLEHLEIKHCSRLQCLPNEGLPTSLEFLLIKDCPELKERCCKGEGLDWGKIEHVPNIWIDHQEISSS